MSAPLGSLKTVSALINDTRTVEKMTSIYSEKSIANKITHDHGGHRLYVLARLLAADINQARAWVSKQDRSHRDISKKMNRYERMTTRLQSFDTVVRCVFETYEIVEMIMYQLPKWDMVAVQRVNKTLRAISIRSPRIQRALCFTPTPPATSQVERTFVPRFNPLLKTFLKADEAPWTFLGPACYKSAEHASVLCLRYAIAQDLLSRQTPIEQYPALFTEGTWKRMLVSPRPYDQVHLKLYAHSRKLVIREEVFENGAMNFDEVQQWLQGAYTDTAASEKWLWYLDPEYKFIPNVGAVKRRLLR